MDSITIFFKPWGLGILQGKNLIILASISLAVHTLNLCLKAQSHRQNVAGAFLERWGEGAEFWQRSSPRTKWQTKSKTRALPERRAAEAGVALALV